MQGDTPAGRPRWGRDARHPFMTSSTPLARVAPVSRQLPSSMGRLPWSTSSISMAEGGGPNLGALDPSRQVLITSNSTEGVARIHQDYIVDVTQTRYGWEKKLVAGDHAFTMITLGKSVYNRSDMQALGMLSGDPTAVGRRLMSGRQFPILTHAMLNLVLQDGMEHVVAILQNPAQLVARYAEFNVQIAEMEALRDFWPSEGLMASVLSPFHQRDWYRILQQPGAIASSPWRNLLRQGPDDYPTGPAVALCAAIKLCASPPFCYAWTTTIMARVRYLGVIASVPPVVATNDRTTGAVLATVNVQGRSEQARNVFMLPEGVGRSGRFLGGFLPVSALLGFRLVRDDGQGPSARPPTKGRAFLLRGFTSGATTGPSQRELAYENNHPLYGMPTVSPRLQGPFAMEPFRENCISPIFRIGRAMSLPSRRRVPTYDMWMRAFGLHPDVALDPNILTSASALLGDLIINVRGKL